MAGAPGAGDLPAQPALIVPPDPPTPTTPPAAGRPNGRPPGLVRLALLAWAQRWADSGQPGGLTAVQLVDEVPGMSSRSPADRNLVRHIVCNLARVGVLIRVGFAPHTPGLRRRRPAVIFRPAPGQHSATDPANSADLAAVLGHWWRP